jgi:hypothetical protein
MLRQTATLFLVLGLTLGAQQKSSNKPTDPAGIMVRGDGFEGVIFPAEMKALGFYPDGKQTQYWTPSEANIVEAESKLVAFLQQAEVPKFQKEKILKNIKTYKRQYVGIVKNGEQDIFINFFCDSGHVEWTRHFVMVDDGGACFFQVTFSTKTKTFSSLMVNGVA